MTFLIHSLDDPYGRREDGVEDRERHRKVLLGRLLQQAGSKDGSLSGRQGERQSCSGQEACPPFVPAVADDVPLVRVLREGLSYDVEVDGRVWESVASTPSSMEEGSILPGPFLVLHLTRDVGEAEEGWQKAARRIHEAVPPPSPSQSVRTIRGRGMLVERYRGPRIERLARYKQGRRRCLPVYNEEDRGSSVYVDARTTPLTEKAVQTVSESTLDEVKTLLSRMGERRREGGWETETKERGTRVEDGLVTLSHELVGSTLSVVLNPYRFVRGDDSFSPHAFLVDDASVVGIVHVGGKTSSSREEETRRAVSENASLLLSLSPSPPLSVVVWTDEGTTLVQLPQFNSEERALPTRRAFHPSLKAKGVEDAIWEERWEGREEARKGRKMVDEMRDEATEGEAVLFGDEVEEEEKRMMVSLIALKERLSVPVRPSKMRRE